MTTGRINQVDINTLRDAQRVRKAKKNDYCKLVAPPKEGPGFHAMSRSTQILTRKEEPEGRTGRDGSRVEALTSCPERNKFVAQVGKNTRMEYAAFGEIGRP